MGGVFVGGDSAAPSPHDSAVAVRPADQAYLERLARSRTAAVRTVTRARILVA